MDYIAYIANLPAKICSSDLCSHGKKACPTPAACQLPEADSDPSWDLIQDLLYAGGCAVAILIILAVLLLSAGYFVNN